MTFETWLIYFLAIIFLCLTPGPNSLLALTNGVRFGVKYTFYSSLGCAIGSALIIAISMSGIGLVLAASVTFFQIIKILGALYLIYLGVNLILAKSESLQINTGSQGISRSRLQLFIQGFTVVVTNPKVLLFFTAFLPQFYNLEKPIIPQYLVLALTFVLFELVLELSLAVLSSSLIENYGSSRQMAWFNRITGGVFIAAGGYLFTLNQK